MGQININSKNLKDRIQELKTLQEKVNNSNIKKPEVVGGGKSIQEIEKIGIQYESLKQSILALVSNTVMFMENIDKSYQDSDKTASSLFK